MDVTLLPLERLKAEAGCHYLSYQSASKAHCKNVFTEGLIQVGWFSTFKATREEALSSVSQHLFLQDLSLLFLARLTRALFELARWRWSRSE